MTCALALVLCIFTTIICQNIFAQTEDDVS
jgi:hypothetical protein